MVLAVNKLIFCRIVVVVWVFEALEEEIDPLNIGNGFVIRVVGESLKFIRIAGSVTGVIVLIFRFRGEVLGRDLR
jgi:hypothetical protein